MARPARRFRPGPGTGLVLAVAVVLAATHYDLFFPPSAPTPPTAAPSPPTAAVSPATAVSTPPTTAPPGVTIPTVSDLEPRVAAVRAALERLLPTAPAAGPRRVGGAAWAVAPRRPDVTLSDGSPLAPGGPAYVFDADPAGNRLSVGPTPAAAVGWVGRDAVVDWFGRRVVTVGGPPLPVVALTAGGEAVVADPSAPAGLRAVAAPESAWFVAVTDGELGELRAELDTARDFVRNAISVPERRLAAGLGPALTLDLRGHATLADLAAAVAALPGPGRPSPARRPVADLADPVRWLDAVGRATDAIDGPTRLVQFGPSHRLVPLAELP